MALCKPWATPDLGVKRAMPSGLLQMVMLFYKLLNGILSKCAVCGFPIAFHAFMRAAIEGIAAIIKAGDI